MDKKRAGVILLGLVLIFSAVIFLNVQDSQKNIVTGKVTEGSECSNQGAADCIGENVAICVNGEWKKFPKVPDKCGYQEDINGEYPPINGGGEDDKETNYWLWIIIAIIVILIIAVVGFIIYQVIKKDNSERNKGKQGFNPKKPITPPKQSPNFSGQGKPPFKSQKPIMKKPLPPQKSPTTKKSLDKSKRYTPPKR